MRFWEADEKPDRDDLEAFIRVRFNLETGERQERTCYRLRGRCMICSRLLNQTDDIRSEDCGGDCLQCMAECGDPDARDALQQAGLPVPPNPVAHN